MVKKFIQKAMGSGIRMRLVQQRMHGLSRDFRNLRKNTDLSPHG